MNHPISRHRSRVDNQIGIRRRNHRGSQLRNRLHNRQEFRLGNQVIHQVGNQPASLRALLVAPFRRRSRLRRQNHRRARHLQITRRLLLLHPQIRLRAYHLRGHRRVFLVVLLLPR